jgi:eukaryotic-like serine/threonine-protein kinase
MDVGDAGSPSGRGHARPSAPIMADRYQALARVGVGGAAVVFRCRDLHTQRIVAVKVLKATGSHAPEAAARFKREARLAATLSYPNIVRVLDYGFTMPLIIGPQTPWADDPDRPVPYLAMEYMFGSTLKEMIRREGQLPLDWVLRIGEQLCAALAAAHAKGVVHRDVKPQNVMLLDSSVELMAKLTDFGIARQIGADLTKLTATGQVIGTPDYLSPEQVMGEPGGQASDLYSLGVVLYELVSGRLPFEADTPLAAASKRMIADPPPLSAWRRDTPPELEEVILAALQREEADRFQTAQELAQALRWSRAQTQPLPTPPAGSWLPQQLARADAQAAPAPRSAQPSLAAREEDGAGEVDLSQQSTILRVVTGFQLDGALPRELEPLAVRSDDEAGAAEN